MELETSENEKQRVRRAIAAMRFETIGKIEARGDLVPGRMLEAANVIGIGV